ncbi:NF-kappa-B essential modulator [Hyposmocoma kahamanoa]|uniref:NF-kappa-B essential modulator n=1 Tax=Hyposmocoma kahamanoa TaxID=1477025 RepID=UPI000E6D8D7E|nr:NF-kappa-B essential modulator [Hyposmocoma kahamanoa]
MASKKSSINEDDSFIILGTSPGTSLDLKCNGVENGQSLDKSQLDDALKDLPPEASVAFKAHFQLEDGPSPASVMVASTIITDDKSTEELQKHFGELLDENIILKETLKHNNDSMKEQFLLIASCQEDMLKTHMMHKEKFDETRELVKKLRQENNKLKQDITRLVDGPIQSQPSSTGTEKSGPSSALEFVTSPDDDTINKLTAQLDLVEKQRRQVSASDSLVQSLGVVASLHDYKLERTTAEQFKNGLGEMKQQLEKHHSMTLNNIGQVRCTLTIFEGIFKEYNELLKKVSTNKETKLADGPNVEALTAALVARGQEINTLNAELKVLRSEKEDTELLKTQLDLYRSDFEAEREAREKMACQKENVLTDLRNVQKRNQELVQQLEEIRKLNPNLVRHTTQPQDRRPAPAAPGAASSGTTTAPRRPAGNGTNSATGNLVKKKKLAQTGGSKETTPPPLRFDCPVCDQSFKSLILLQQHVDSCLL